MNRAQQLAQGEDVAELQAAAERAAAAAQEAMAKAQAAQARAQAERDARIKAHDLAVLEGYDDNALYEQERQAWALHEAAVRADPVAQAIAQANAARAIRRDRRQEAESIVNTYGLPPRRLPMVGVDLDPDSARSNVIDRMAGEISADELDARSAAREAAGNGE